MGRGVAPHCLGVKTNEGGGSDRGTALPAADQKLIFASAPMMRGSLSMPVRLLKSIALTERS